MNRKLTFHSGTELALEEGGSLLISRYLTENGALRTVVSVPSGSFVPVPAMTDRDAASLCGLLLSFSFAPAELPVPVLGVQASENEAVQG